jgi:hypothetical protein
MVLVERHWPSRRSPSWVAMQNNSTMTDHRLLIRACASQPERPYRHCELSNTGLRSPP